MTALLVLSLLAQAPADGGTAIPLEFSQRLLPEAVQLGEPFTHELVVTHPLDARYEVTFPAELGAFELLQQSRSREDGPSRAVTTFRLQLAAFELGEKALPQLTFQVTTPGGVKTFLPPPPTLQVRSSLPPPEGEEASAELKDLRPPTEVAVRSLRLVWAALAVLASGGLLWALARWLRQRRERAMPQPPPLPLHVRTLQALDALKAEGLPAQGRSQEFYFRLSEIVRRYLGERYAFEALECTSSELLESMRARATPGLSESELRAFIHESDLVKYAKADATPDSCVRSLDFGYALVQSTPAPPTPATNASGPHVP